MTAKIVQRALQVFTGNTGIKATWKATPTALKGIGLNGYVRFQAGKLRIEIPAEIKNSITAAHLPQLHEIKVRLGKLLLLAGAIRPREQHRLKELGIFFIDSAGNTFIRQDGLIVLAEGKRTELNIAADARAFSKGGIKVIFQLLLTDNLLNATMREIATRAGVSLDTVHKTIQGLKAMQYMIPVNAKTWIWNNKQQLLTNWMNEYDRRLKPGLFISRFDFLSDPDFDHWKQLKFMDELTCWGGEPAGELLTNNLKPAELTIYTNETEMQLVKHYHMVPKKAGAIIVYKRFWPQMAKEKKFAPPLLVYTDLVNNGERRNIETAQKIFNEHLQDKFQSA